MESYYHRHLMSIPRQHNLNRRTFISQFYAVNDIDYANRIGIEMDTATIASVSLTMVDVNDAILRFDINVSRDDVCS